MGKTRGLLLPTTRWKWQNFGLFLSMPWPLEWHRLATLKLLVRIQPVSFVMANIAKDKSRKRCHMSNTYKDLQNSHPCFGGHKNNAGRIHLPISPGCNIACRFCDRTINDVEERPGVTSKVLKPEECEDILTRALEICPDIRVAGIAGPGDTLATDNALKTFMIIKDRFPKLIKCMSTNGLLLSERAQEIIDIGVDSLTVTVNVVDPVIEEKLNAYIIYHGKKIEGVEAAKILIENRAN